MPHEFAVERPTGARSDPICAETAVRERDEPFATVDLASGQVAEIRIDELRRCGRWAQSRETFARLGHLSEEERSDMWAATADFERMHADRVDPIWLNPDPAAGTP